MKTKLLKQIRNRWEYKFRGGSIVARRKEDGCVVEHGNMEQFLRFHTMDTFFWEGYKKWINRKIRIAEEKKWRIEWSK
jgi:hypothetical protein